VQRRLLAIELQITSSHSWNIFSFYHVTAMMIAGAAGLLVSINRIATKSLMNDVRASTLLFFGISMFFVVICCGAFHATQQTDFVQFYVNVCRTSVATVEDDQRSIMRPVSAGGTNLTSAEEVSLVRYSHFISKHHSSF